jgi:leucyl aminopeptidase
VRSALTSALDLLGAYSYTRYRSGSTGTPPKSPVASVTLVSPAASGGPARAAVKRAKVVAAAVHGTRDLVNAAPVDLYPAAFAEEAVTAVKDLPIQVTVLDERRLSRGGYGGILGVGLGSSRPPRLVRLDYAPAGATTHVALVGKGITFDSGGLSIKPAAGMDAMKSDMSGAAAVLHTVAGVAQLGLPVRVSGWLALAENMPSGTAQRPSDVLTVRGGRTVEVLNTDAEGRLVLADAIVAAGEEEPDVIVDIATLTGAQMVALGNRTSAIMANDDELRDRVHAVADRVGEQFWPMPLPPELRASMDSRVADIANIGDRFGGMLVAGLFLQEFVPARGEGDDAQPVPWAHLDIAGPAFNTGSAHDYTPAGGTGVGVRTLLGLCEELAR